MSDPLRVAQLWRYPVKSMQGERCAELRINDSGIESDRMLAVNTESGKLGSGKTTRRFERVDGLIEFGAHARDGGAWVSLPDGGSLPHDDPGLNPTLSRALNRPVTLERQGRHRHLDAAPVHVLSTASLRWLHSALPDASVDVRRFRPNIVIEADGVTPLEQGWIGRRLTIGEGVVLEVTEPTVRCRMVSFSQRDLPDDARILEYLARRAKSTFGVYASVVSAGTIREGDEVRLSASGRAP